MTERKTSHGGSRKGAGRKPIHGEKTRAATFALPESYILLVEDLADDKGVSRSVAAADIFKAGLTKLKLL